MYVAAAISAIVIIAIILGDAFETIILPRRVTRRFRLARLFYRTTWLMWSGAARRWTQGKRRERVLSYYGPLSLLVLLVVWAVGMIIGFAILHWSLGSLLADQEPSNFLTDLYFSGSTFFTIGLGDVHPTRLIARFLTVMEGGMGFGFLAMVIGYLPVIYEAFSAREANISLLDARAGSPPSAGALLRRYAENNALDHLNVLLHDWERWAAELLESHISYPVLAMFRSQHDNQSWLASLTAILDATALLVVGVHGADNRQARLTFAMSRHVVVDLAQVLQQPPSAPGDDRLPPDDLQRLRIILTDVGAPLRGGLEADRKLAELRHMYEPYVNSLASFLMVSLPAWLPADNRPDNWQTSAWERAVRKITALEVYDDHV